MNGAPSSTKSTATENSVTTRLIVEYTGFRCATTTSAEATASSAKMQEDQRSPSSEPPEPAGEGHRGDQRSG